MPAEKDIEQAEYLPITLSSKLPNPSFHVTGQWLASPNIPQAELLD